MKNKKNELHVEEQIVCEEESNFPEMVLEAEEGVVEEITPSQQIEGLEAEIATLKQLYARSVADYANLKQRSEKQKRDILSNANSVLVGKLLPIIDNFERALVTIEDPKVKAGVEMIYRQLSDLLVSEGLEKIEAENLPFDPYVHEALFQEHNEKVADNTVLQVFEPGYRFKNKLLRAAKVKVSTL